MTPPQPRKVGEVELRRALEVVEKATPGRWQSYRATKYFHLRTDAGDYIMEGGYRGMVRTQQDSAAIMAAVNWTRTHAEPLLAELEALRVENLRLGVDLQAANEAAAASAEYAMAARVDARRYRWLRDPANADNSAWGSILPMESTAEQIDSAIDAALALRDKESGE